MCRFGTPLRHFRNKAIADSLAQLGWPDDRQPGWGRSAREAWPDKGIVRDYASTHGLGGSREQLSLQVERCGRTYRFG